ncbi:MAG: serine/threonine-protein kinase [Polyangiales bacterium]
MPIRVCPQCNSRFRDAASRCPHDGAELQVRPDPLVGRVLGRRYRILDEIGSGGMGTVYRARHVLVGRDVAIKLLSRSATRDPMWRERFLREAQTTNLLKHENIVDVTDFGDEGGSVFLVMELLEGESLEERLTRETLSPVEAIDIALPVAAALARAHQLDVVHRDIKPGNIFLSSAPLGARVKVLDFGIARAAGDAKLTDTGVLLGTPEYMSPEQSLGQTVGPASDLYALGVVLYESIAGRLPFLGAGAHLLVQHVHDAPPRLQALCPEVPDALDAAVMRLLAKSPAERFADAHALIAALSAARRERPSSLGGRAGEARREGAALEPFRSRAETLEASLRASFPDALPAPVASLAEAMRRAYDELAVATREGGGVASELVATDTRHRTTLSRIGGALDELSRDASEVRGRIEAARLRHRAAELDARSAAEALDGQRPTPSLGLDPFDQKTTPDVVAEVERGARDARLRAAACLAELRALEAEADDLAFQIQALRGRMGAVSGELQAEREASEQRANELASRVAEAQDAFVAAADSLSLAVDGGRRGG